MPQVNLGFQGRQSNTKLGIKFTTVESLLELYHGL